MLHPVNEYWVDPTDGGLPSRVTDAQYSVWLTGFTASACGGGLMLLMQVCSGQRPLMGFIVTTPSISQKRTLHKKVTLMQTVCTCLSLCVCVCMGGGYFTLGMGPQPEQ